MDPEKNFMVRREVVAMCLESPLYSTMTLRKRLDFLKTLEQQVFWSKLRAHLIHRLNH